MNVLFVAIGGFFGAILRFYVGQQLNKPNKQQFWGTMLANVLGSSLLALLFLMLERSVISTHLWALLGIGFCGAFTTFSTFSMEAVSMIQNRHYLSAVRYVSFSFLLSIVSMSLILWIGL
ncbi:fluoride efflux transporter CrcB [Radiobacillus kanasensis]|uniref:fluoride efflux transporter CrcB n=1 Tax=Radiobacillus kanasensis TaxID=2844358 RepID=UPI001E47493F|nr:fluoride efflux transporter CrcB [Radiobacillus kanasensis]UFT98267.1 fluoride efflux transporter CrcB [Radiobacillus kanasensis]